MNNVSNLSGAEKDRILAALLHDHPQLMETVVQQVTGNNMPRQQQQQQQPQQQQHQRVDHGSASSSSSTDSETSRTMNSPPAPASRKRRRPRPAASLTVAAARSNKKRARKKTTTTPIRQARITPSQDANWQLRYQELLDYKKIHHTTLVPVHSSALGKWVHNQRQAFRAYQSGQVTATGGATITAERIQALNDVGFVWSTLKEPLVSFERRLEQMRMYKMEHGHLKVPTNHASGLAAWMQSQRNRQHSMTRERWHLLDAAGMAWVKTSAAVAKKKRSSTNNNTNASRSTIRKITQAEFRNDTHASVAADADAADVATTATTQMTNNYPPLARQQQPCQAATAMAHHAGATTMQEDAAAMKDDAPKKQRWQSRYDELIEYKRVHGTTLVPVNSSALGKWVHNQRQAYRAYHSDKPAKGPTLTAERIQALNDIGFVWNTLKEPLVSFETRLEQMRKYKQEHGNLRVSKRDDDMNGLSWWLQSQRNRQHSMSRERFAQLEAAGMEWDTMMKERSNTSNTLTDNNKKKKNTTSSSSKPRATTRQDSAMKAVPRKERWQLRYDELVEYKRAHGTTLVPVNSSALGKWVGNMRQAYRDYHSGKPAIGPTLNEQRIQKLNDIGFVWNALKKEPLVS